jgi:resuscitation-promoting factor RpfA
MADSEDDDDFEAYLKRRVPIDQRMKTVDRLEPPPELDRVVIGKARNAIQNSSHVPMYRAPKWALPVGLAATLLIAFSIVLELGIRSSRQQLASAPAVAAATSSESVAAPAPAAPTVPSVSAPQETTPAGSAGADSSAAASAKTFARMRPPPIKTAPWPPLPRAAAKLAAPSDAASSGSATTESKAEFDPRSRSAERRVAEKRMRTNESERVAAAAADVSSPPANAAPDVATAAPAPRVASSAAAVPTPAAPPPRPLVDATANAEAPAPMRLAASSPRASAVTFDGTKVIEPHSVERFDSASGGLPARAAAPAVAPAAAAAADRREHPDPKAWLDQIQKMRVAGLTAQAEQELKHFRDAYPAYPTASTDSGAQ